MKTALIAATIVFLPCAALAHPICTSELPPGYPCRVVIPEGPAPIVLPSETLWIDEESLVHTPVAPVNQVVITPPPVIPPRPSTSAETSITNNYYGDVYIQSGNTSGWDWRSRDDSYYSAPFTLSDLETRCPALDKSWAARALPYYATNYSFFQLWRMEINWNSQRDYEEACRIFASPTTPIPSP